eukprot:243287-Chlamydomonas_euryale.AAC.9
MRRARSGAATRSGPGAGLQWQKWPSRVGSCIVHVHASKRREQAAARLAMAVSNGQQRFHHDQVAIDDS